MSMSFLTRARIARSYRERGQQSPRARQETELEEAVFKVGSLRNDIACECYKKERRQAGRGNYTVKLRK